MLNLSCHLDHTGNPPAQIVWLQNSLQVSAHHVVTVVSEDGSATSDLSIKVTDEPIEIICEAISDATTAQKDVIKVTPESAPTTTTTMKSTTILSEADADAVPHAEASRSGETIMINSNSNTVMRSELLSDKHDIHDIPVADMPHSDDNAVDYYDYSHFEYVNENSYNNWQETVRYAEDYYEYTEDDYNDEAEQSEAEREENSILIKKLKEEFGQSSGASYLFFTLPYSLLPSILVQRLVIN